MYFLEREGHPKQTIGNPDPCILWIDILVGDLCQIWNANPGVLYGSGYGEVCVTAYVQTAWRWRKIYFLKRERGSGAGHPNQTIGNLYPSILWRDINVGDLCSLWDARPGCSMNGWLLVLWISLSVIFVDASSRSLLFGGVQKKKGSLLGPLDIPILNPDALWGRYIWVGDLCSIWDHRSSGVLLLGTLVKNIW